MKKKFVSSVSIDGASLCYEDVVAVAQKNMQVKISATTLKNVQQMRDSFDKLAAANVPIYGVTTGYGEMVYASVNISEETALQTNLIRSHCAGAGSTFSAAETRAIMLARLNSLARGNSAVRPELLHQLSSYLNNGIIPMIPEIGSLGASGDLGPLAHLASTLIGEGYVLDGTKRRPTADKLREVGLSALTLRFKEGLSLINGTSAMTGITSLLVDDAFLQIRTAEIISALVVEVLQGSSSPFLRHGHDIARPHKGQIDSAANIRTLIAGSDLVQSHASLCSSMTAARGENKQAVAITDVYIQKAYTLRCIPQVVGAIRDTLYHTRNVVEIELNSSNDNPLFFPGEEIFHGGNFHGQPVAFVADFLGIAMIQLGVISERRTNRLLNKALSGGLPEFLVHGDPGIKSGMAGLQYPATAVIAENRTLAVPASVQSIPSNGDNQDVVSMGLVGVRKTRTIIANNWIPLAVEAMAAVQAVHLSSIAKSLSPAGFAAFSLISDTFPKVTNDRYLADDLDNVVKLLSSGTLLKAVQATGIELS